MVAVHWSWISVAVFWACSMGWLTTNHLLPRHIGDDPPTGPIAYLGLREKNLQVGWTVFYAKRKVGTIDQRVTRFADGALSVESHAQFDDLPLEDLARGLLGSLGSLLRPALASRSLPATPFLVESQFQLDSKLRLKTASVIVGAGDRPKLLRLAGNVLSGRFDVVAEIPVESGSWQEIYHDDFHLSDTALFSDSIVPYSRLENLAVGRTWRVTAFRPFSMWLGDRQVQARVAALEEIQWNGMTREAFRVDFEDVMDNRDHC